MLREAGEPPIWSRNVSQNQCFHSVKISPLLPYAEEPVTACRKLFDKTPTSFLNFSAVIQRLKGNKYSPTVGTFLISNIPL